MDIAGPSQPPLTLSLASSSAPQWQLGQRLDAVVVSLNGQDGVTLQIGTTLIEARTSVAVAIGQQLSLQVLEADKQIVLRIDTSPSQADTPAAGQRTATLVLTNPPASAAMWQAGQRLEAVVSSLISRDKIALRIGEAVFEAHTSTALAPGQRLSLQVVQTGRQTVLSVSSGSEQANPLLAALRKALPQQIPLEAAFNRIGEILASPQGLPPTAVALLKQLFQGLPGEQSLSRPEALKQTLLDSGQFLEHKLNANAQASSSNNDIKANLLRLLAELTQSSGDGGTDLTRHVEAALARIQTHQLAALAQEQSPPAWAGELPVRVGDQVNTLQFRIEKDAAHSANAEQQSWSTWLSLNLQALGPLHVKISLTKHNISTAFWAESSATAALVNENLDYLQQALQRAGLEVKDIQCRQGRPPFPAPDRLPKGLLDISA